MIVGLFVEKLNNNVTDRQTDGRTDRWTVRTTSVVTLSSVGFNVLKHLAIPAHF